MDPLSRYCIHPFFQTILLLLAFGASWVARDTHVARDWWYNTCNMDPWGPYRPYGPYPPRTYEVCIEKAQKNPTYRNYVEAQEDHMLNHAPPKPSSGAIAVLYAGDFGVGLQSYCMPYSEDRFCARNPRISACSPSEGMRECTDNILGREVSQLRAECIDITFYNRRWEMDIRRFRGSEACVWQATLEETIG
jgi:hypothetical protein